MTKSLSPPQLAATGPTIMLPDEEGNVHRDLMQEVMHHPLFTGEVLIATPPATELFLIAKRAILLRENGLCFTGPSGIGKTEALNVIKAMLQRQYPRLCIFTHDGHNQQIPSIRAFFKHFLKTVGQSEQRGETFDLRERLVRILIDHARTSGTNLVVMLVDEANAMIQSDFLFLKDVYNDLAREHVQLITILMGQSPDLQGVINKLRAEQRNDLIGRFATRVLPIRGYNQVSDLQAIFNAIDRLESPEGSGISWTAFFLPRACRGGFRLENEAQKFHDAVSAEGDGVSPSVWSLPARQAFLAIREFLVSASAHDSATLKLPISSWRDAVVHAKLQDAIARMNGTEKSQKKRRRQ